MGPRTPLTWHSSYHSWTQVRILQVSALERIQATPVLKNAIGRRRNPRDWLVDTAPVPVANMTRKSERLFVDGLSW